MQSSTPIRETATGWTGETGRDQQRRKLVIAIVLLLAALATVAAKDRELWSHDDEDSTAANSTLPISMPGPKPELPAITKLAVVDPKVAKVSTGGVSANRAPGSSMVANSPQRNAHRLSSRATLHTSATTWASGSVPAAERVQMSTPARQPATAYPLLSQAMAVQGSVLLQALIGADGMVGEMRVISGPTILVSAARQAVQQWRFNPYLVNGKPVETYARVTVNFTIDISNTEARYHVNSVSSSPAL